jgi:hypothetical protein
VADVTDRSDVERIVDACDEKLNPSDEWAPFCGYPDSLALSVLDAIWSINARYAITRGVVERYRARRSWQGNPDEDDLSDLLSFYEAMGGVDSFIDEIGTRNRVSTQPGAVRKGEAVFQAATSLVGLGVDTAVQFRDGDGGPLGEQIKTAWLALPGQRSGVSWRYLRMLVGLPDVKPDRMVIRFIASALSVDEQSVGGERAVALVQATAEHFGADQRALDHEIWEYQSGKRGGHDPVAESDHLAALAHSFIGATFPELARLHVIPTSHYHPFVQVGRDYEGADASGPELAEFEAMLQTRYPERFAEPLTREDPEFPNSYIFNFLEGAITRCARTGDDVYEADTPPVQEAVEELLHVLDRPDYTLTCCRAMSHLTTRGNEPVHFGEITVYSENSTRDLIERTKDLIPAAPSAFNRERPFFYDPPHSLIVASTTARGGNPFAVAGTLTGSIDRFLLVTRLLYSGTPESAWQVTGASTLVSQLHPLYQTFSDSGMPNLLMQRVIEFAPEHAPAITALSDFLDAAVVKREKMVATSFDIALSNYNRSHESGDHYERVVDLATALEAILTGSDTDTEAVGLRLRSRAAALLWTESDSGRDIFRDVATLYSLRSRLVHGAKITQKELLKWLHSVSTVPEDSTYGVAFSFAVDRLRDLVRRSFLARLCLASGDDPLWRFEEQVPVDAALSDEASRARWRMGWRDTLSTLGVAEAAEPAIRAVDPIHAPTTTGHDTNTGATPQND